MSIPRGRDPSTQIDESRLLSTAVARGSGARRDRREGRGRERGGTTRERVEDARLARGMTE
ncbi:hypothetical protein C450_01894 [Halococcus salifodinae DSM 8989]|uniref:Uncharacterized protein n=1 Tax=Halococcus salifodinae DSM 8989 TaxID=1227456 RepID=M0NEH2_9EURY|nr:hypothetical protein C450_01894 [Halococcus salifodinae DSM 8989]